MDKIKLQVFISALIGFLISAVEESQGAAVRPKRSEWSARSFSTGVVSSKFFQHEVM